MHIVESIPILREKVCHWRREGKRIALVPTLGNLHEGHMTLVKKAQKLTDRVVVSIFVNRLQFNDSKDFENYPRTFSEDCDKLKHCNIDLIFHPSTTTMYPDGMENQTYVEVPGVSDILEGASRPGYFRGVTTIVCKLFNVVQPHIAFFGEKDFQQLHLIRKMVQDLALDIRIISVPTVRAENGLAMSSRNELLSHNEQQIASKLYEVMTNMGEKMTSSERNVEVILAEAKEQLRNAGFTPEPLFIRDATTLQPLTDESKKAVILMAVFLGQTRLIDNLQVDLS